MTEQPCTALDPRDDRADLLVTPPCDCPRCAPERFYDPAPVDDGWLRMSGTPQRYRVEGFELGPTGRAALGSGPATRRGGRSRSSDARRRSPRP